MDSATDHAPTRASSARLMGFDDREAAPRRPSRRAFVLHRLAAVAADDTRESLAAMAADLVSELRGRWGDVRLELAPAFR